MSLEQQLLRMQVDGWCILEGIIPEDCIAVVREHVQTATEKHRNPKAPDRIGHVSGFINFDKSLAPYLADRRMLDLVEEMLGPYSRISFTSATINEPGNARGGWHADWPFNQNNGGHIPAPYPDVVFHLTTIWMLTPFSGENGGTLIVPGSHRSPDNPTADNGVPPGEPYATEMNVSGNAGSVLVMDSRLWHATAANTTADPRVAVVVRYAPWWLNLDVLKPDSADRQRMVDETGRNENMVPQIPGAVYDGLPDDVKPLFRHWLV